MNQHYFYLMMFSQKAKPTGNRSMYVVVGMFTCFDLDV